MVNKTKEILIIGRKKAASVIRNNKKRYRELINTIPDIIYEIDANGVFTFISDAVNQLGYVPRELIGKHFKEIVHPDDLKAVCRRDVLPKYKGKITGDADSPKLFDERRTGKRMTRNLEVRLLSKNQESLSINCRYFEAHSSGRWNKDIHEKDKIFLGCVGSLRDITARKRTENMLIQSEKLASLGRLVSDIAHEINNPLMVISGNAQIILSSETISAEAKSILETIMDQCQGATNIMLRVLKFAQPSKGEAMDVDISQSIDMVVGVIEKQFKIVNVEIKRNYPKKPILVSIDNQLVQEVFMNLLNNAKDAMPDGGTITIAASLEEGFIRIVFKDTGCGMSEDAKKRLFEPFFTTKEKGTGLGLPICYGIIKAHNGELKFESQSGKGTTATVLLPLGGG